MSEVALSRRKLLVGAGATVVAAALPQISLSATKQITFEWTPLPSPLEGEALDRMAKLWGLARDWLLAPELMRSVDDDFAFVEESDASLRLRLLETINGVGASTKVPFGGFPWRCYDTCATKNNCIFHGCVKGNSE